MLIYGHFCRLIGLSLIWKIPTPPCLLMKELCFGEYHRSDGSQCYGWLILFDSWLHTINNELSLIPKLGVHTYFFLCTVHTGRLRQVACACPDEVDSVWKIQWSATAAGSSLSVACVENNPQLGTANRLCNVGRVWDPVDATDCESEDGNRIRMEVDHYMRIYEWNGYTIANGHFLQTDRFVNNLKDPSAPLSPNDRSVLRGISDDLSVVMWHAVDDVFAKALCVRRLGKSWKWKGDK